jgi:hypothetical protein
MSTVIVPARFKGPARSGNGGWTAGALAARVEQCPDDRSECWPTIEVSLRQPPPLDTPLALTITEGGVLAGFGGIVIAEATVTEQEIEPVAEVDAASAAAAVSSYPGLRQHPFPTCFSCGTGREEGDGLRIFPGRVDDSPAGRQRVAAPWTPHPSVSEDFHTYTDEVARASLPVTWAALDCVGGWAGDLAERAMVLGRIAAQVDALPAIGEPHVVVGELLGVDGRKTLTASTLYDADGRIVARATHTWVAVDPARFNDL